MRNFKYISRMLQIIIFVAVLAMCEIIASNVMVQPGYSHYFNHDVQKIINNEDDVEMIILGASRTYRTFVPKVIEEKFGFSNVLNAGSSSQPIDGTYYQLKYLLTKFSPRYVIVGVTWNGLRAGGGTQQKLIVSDRLPFVDKIIYGLKCFKSDFLYLSNLYRFRETLSGDWKNVCLNNYNSLKEIQEGTKKINTEEKEYYADKGFVYGNKSNETGSFVMEEGRYSPASNKERNIYYLDKISSLCEKKGVKLYFVSGPTSVERLYAVEGYQDAVDYYSQYAQRHGTKYFNLNYLIGRESFLPDEMMHDRNHVNGKGAELVSTVFAEILEKELEGEDVSAYFYSSLDELKKEVDRIVAVGYNISNSDGKIVINTKCLANEDVVPEYRISISADKSIYEIVSDFSETTEYMFDVTEYENCWVMIEVKQKGRENIDAYQKDISLKEGLK